MISSMIHNQNDAKTQDSNIFSKNEISETIISSKAFEQQTVQHVDEFDRENTSFINHVFVFKITSTLNWNEKNLDEEYQRLLAIKRKTQQAKKILFMKKQKNKDWFAFIFTLFMHLKNADSSQIENVSLTEREQDMRRERYLEITKSEIYKNHNFQKFDIFMKACQIVFDVRLIIYNDDFD
jgi:hypothetical protein